MTATDELRRMLDERGVEWDELIGHPVVVGTEWLDRDGCSCSALEHAYDVPDGMLSVQANLIPEQAIEATLGRGECHNASYRLDESRFHCSECGFGCWVKDVADGRDKLPRFCPNCGRKVVGE